MIKLESREDGRYLACSCLLRCVVTQRPGSTVNCYHQCCFHWALCQVLKPPESGTSPQSSLCPHWLCQQVFWKGPHPCSLVQPFTVSCAVVLKRMRTTSQTTVATAKQQERSRHPWSRVHTLVRSEVNLWSLHSPVGLAVSHSPGNDGGLV